MIRGMGLFGPDGVSDVDDVRSWQQPGDGHPEPKLRDLFARCSESPDDFVWLGLFEPTRDELEMVARVFGLSRLHVEDCANDQQRAKFELDEDGKLKYVAEADESRRDDIESAADVCPMQAISVE